MQELYVMAILRFIVKVKQKILFIVMYPVLQDDFLLMHPETDLRVW